jgi:hypothetical protein
MEFEDFLAPQFERSRLAGAGSLAAIEEFVDQLVCQPALFRGASSFKTAS